MSSFGSMPHYAGVRQFGERRWRTAIAALVLLAAVNSAAHAAEPVGRVIAVQGTVTAIDDDSGERRSLAFDDVVYPGDTLSTSDNGRIQIRFQDDGLVALAPESRFEIERYGESDEQTGGSVLMRLIEGAVRTITGSIGERDDDQYELMTPVATVGIRGTEYALDYCAANCAGQDRRPGLYGRVDDGEITVSTEVDTGAFAMGEHFYVASADSMPRPITTPPKGLRFNLGRDEADAGGSDDRDAAPPQQGSRGLPEPAAANAWGAMPGGEPGDRRQGHPGGAPNGGQGPGSGASAPGDDSPAAVHPPGGPKGRQGRS